MAAISLNDKPINALNREDTLNVSRYINALTKFIVESDTPITIGLQGEWGTGKTSMMYLLQEELRARNIATSWVNTWQYSLFRDAKETTPAILNALLSNLKESCGTNWTIKEKGDKLVKIGRFFSHLGNQFVKDKLGIDAEAAANEANSGFTHTRIEIAEIKKDIQEIIDTLISDSRNPYQRVVFFVDDLDRINPSEAVQVLESLKNIFDFENCVFVLAIDYDVVVKGLESKFGKKTEENEREFRSFFDKIIQVPFSMPIGTYDIDSFLISKLQNLGLEVATNQKQIYLQIVKQSVGYNPRSLKRYLNTFSLLNTIRKADGSDTDSEVELMLFALLGIQISFPKIFRYLTINSSFLQWDKSFATKHSLDWVEIANKLEQFGENDLTDEDWEKVVWGFCQSDLYLKNRAFSILELLNLIKNSFQENLDEVLNSALAFASITSIDDNQEVKQNIIQIGTSRIRFNGLDAKKEQLLSERRNKEAIKVWEEVFTVLEQKMEKPGDKINFGKSVTSFYRLYDKNEGKPIQTIYFTDPSSTAGISVVIYGFNEEFLVNTIKIFNNFNISVNEAELYDSEGLVEVVPGLMIHNKNQKDKTYKHGYINIGKKLIETLSLTDITKILLEIINTMY